MYTHLLYSHSHSPSECVCLWYYTTELLLLLLSCEGTFECPAVTAMASNGSALFMFRTCGYVHVRQARKP